MWYSLVYKALILTSVVLFIIGFVTDSTLSVNAYIVGYSVLSLGILTILSILFSSINKNEPTPTSTSKMLYSLLLAAGPFILILSIVAFVLYLLIYYKSNIINGHVSSGYYSFSNVIVILLLCQIYMIYSNANFETTGKISKITSTIILLLSVLTGISAIILYTILKYYSTDGFDTINHV